MNKPTRAEREAYIMQYIKEHGLIWWCQESENSVTIIMSYTWETHIVNPSEQLINFLREGM